MAFTRCAACPSPGACDETVPEGSDKPGMCWNTYMNLQAHKAQQAQLAGKPAPAATSAPGTPAAPVVKPVAAPSVPGAGSVTERIFATCDAVLAVMWPAPREGQSQASYEQRLAAARKQAIPQLEAAGVNSNSARKGSAMWIAARR